MAKFELTIEDVGEDQVTMSYDLNPDVSELAAPEDATPTQLAGVAIITLLLQHIFPQADDEPRDESGYPGIQGLEAMGD